MNTLAQQLANGERHVEALLEQTAEQLRAAGFTPDELFIRDADSLQPLTVDSQRAVVLMAAAGQGASYRQSAGRPDAVSHFYTVVTLKPGHW